MSRIQIDDLPVELPLPEDEQKDLSGGATPQLSRLQAYSYQPGGIVLRDYITYTVSVGIADGTSNTMMQF